MMVMVRQIEAIYSNGVFHPLEPLALHEGQRVQLTVHVSSESTEPVKERREEMAWLANESGPYAGQWVALHGGRLIAHGTRLPEVSIAARAAGVDHPFYSRVPVADNLSDAPATPHLKASCIPIGTAPSRIFSTETIFSVC